MDTAFRDRIIFTYASGYKKKCSFVNSRSRLVAHKTLQQLNPPPRPQLIKGTVVRDFSLFKASAMVLFPSFTYERWLNLSFAHWVQVNRVNAERDSTRGEIPRQLS